MANYCVNGAARIPHHANYTVAIYNRPMPTTNLNAILWAMSAQSRKDVQPIVLLQSMIGYWHHNVVCLVCMSVCLSVTLCIVTCRVGVQG